MTVDGTIELLRALIAHDTTSVNSNLVLVDWLVSRLEDASARIRLTYDQAGQKANVLASFGPEGSGGILLSAHTDVVPVDGQAWNSDPFKLLERDGRLHGRGAADMKGFIACCLAASSDWAEARLRRPIHLALSYDEEIGCFGVPLLIEDLLQQGSRPEIAIVGEPTGMLMADRHRGYYGFRTVFHGQAAHSSDPRKGVNAIAAASRFIYGLDLIQGDHADGVERTTYSVGCISGGTNINVVPSRCEVQWEIRPAASANVLALKRSAADLIASAARSELPPATSEIIAIPPLRPTADTDVAALAARFGVAVAARGVPFGTEAGFFQSAGIPTVVCGPGSIEQAHQADEWIAPQQLLQASCFLARVTRWASS